MVLDDTLFTIDFQDARMGPVLYDLASLAFDSYVEFEDEAAGLPHRSLLGDLRPPPFLG